MSENITLARPYAKAAFEYAVEQDQINPWNNFLQRAAMVVSDKSVQNLIRNPSLNESEKKQFIIDVCENSKEISKPQHNFINLLAKFQRLILIPEIALSFDDLSKERGKSIEVDVISAYPLATEQEARLQKALSIRLQREVTINIKYDENLIGGAIVRAKDFVIDGTVRGQLKRLSQSIMQ